MTSKKMVLSGGTGGEIKATVYTAPNGVVVTSSVPSFDGGSSYLMKYLFNETYGTGSNTVAVHTDYWLTQGGDFVALLFDFTALPSQIIDTIKVWPMGRMDSPTHYRILISYDSINWEAVTDWQYHTDQDKLDTVHEHNIGVIDAPYVLFELIRNGAWGCALKEIEFYTKPIKCLVQENNIIKTWQLSANESEQGWKEIGQAPVTKAMFDAYGITNLSKVRQQMLSVFSDTKELLFYFDEKESLAKKITPETKRTENSVGWVREYQVVPSENNFRLEQLYARKVR